ncbi:MAG: hypothetical protein Q8Q50_02115 [Methylobacter sp.]|nr:hypothetical protein [Methylobacter sp.]
MPKKRAERLCWKWLIAVLLLCTLPTIGAAANTCDQACRQQIDKLVRQASVLNTNKRYTEAADLLERLLMEYPDAEGAAQQYSRALAGLDSQQDNQPPAQPEQTEPPEPADSSPHSWQTSGDLQMRGGYSSNFNQAPTQPTIQLTLPDETVTLELQPQFQQQAGFGMESQLSGNAGRLLTDTLQWQVRGELFNRETGYSGYADYQGANLLSTLLQQWDDGAESGAALGFNTQRYGGNIYLYTTQMMLRHTGKKGAYCKPLGGLDLVWQRQYQNALLDSRYTGLMLGALCDTTLGFYSATINAGWDWASSRRPGGDQQRNRLEILGIWPTDAVIKNSFVKAHTDVMYSNDMQSYSSWLSDGATRYMNRVGVGLDYDWPLTAIANNWRGTASVRWQNQDSNISLFETDTLEGWMGVRITW